MTCVHGMGTAVEIIIMTVDDYQVTNIFSGPLVNRGNTEGFLDFQIN